MPTRTISPLPLLAMAWLGAASACATPHPTATAAPGEPDLRFAPEEVKVSKLDLELSDKNDEELFTVGTAAYEAGDWARAAAAFARIPDRFERSRHVPAALFNAGLAFEKLQEWRLALERFRTLANGWEGPDALESLFKIAECQYNLHELADAHGTLAAIAARPGLAPAAQVRALTQLGVVELEDGRPDDAEKTLRRALSAWQLQGEQERLDPFFPAQAEYYLGEAYRGWFLALPVDPSSGDEQKLQDALEHKSEMLLSAQGHYLRSIRMGDDRWAVAAGARIGELYDTFRRQLLEAPLPPDLDAEGQRAYREELRKRVRILAAKAVSLYEAALGRASRSGVNDLQALGEARDALQRLKDALKDEAGAGI
jgi:hypothetical protein